MAVLAAGHYLVHAFVHCFAAFWLIRDLIFFDIVEGQSLHRVGGMFATFSSWGQFLMLSFSCVSALLDLYKLVFAVLCGGVHAKEHAARLCWLRLHLDRFFW